jgi:hypothetical protein
LSHVISVFPLDSTSLKQLNSLALQRIQRRSFKFEDRPDLGTVFEIIATAGFNYSKNAFMISPALCYFFIRQQRLQRFQAFESRLRNSRAKTFQT